MLCFRCFGAPLLGVDLAVWERFVLLANFCFKITAGIKITRREATFCALAAVALQLYVLRQRDLETAQGTFS